VEVDEYLTEVGQFVDRMHARDTRG
jgi:hypothetical protein